jgi:hypothetical protein
VVEKPAEWDRLKAMVLDSVSSPITKRVYNMAPEEFLAWFRQGPRPGFTKATVSAWRDFTKVSFGQLLDGSTPGGFFAEYKLFLENVLQHHQHVTRTVSLPCDSPEVRV